MEKRYSPFIIPKQHFECTFVTHATDWCNNWNKKCTPIIRSTRDRYTRILEAKELRWSQSIFKLYKQQHTRIRVHWTDSYVFFNYINILLTCGAMELTFFSVDIWFSSRLLVDHRPLLKSHLLQCWSQAPQIKLKRLENRISIEKKWKHHSFIGLINRWRITTHHYIVVLFLQCVSTSFI